jgi:hypothetical protein
MSQARAFAIRLTIPDNEARTAAATLARLGVELGSVERCDVWLFEVEEGAAESLAAGVRADETLFNPNKHRLDELRRARPEPGEVWVEGDLPARPARLLQGVTSARRLTGWRLRDTQGRPAAREVIDRAVERLLCNPAYQRAVLPEGAPG